MVHEVQGLTEVAEKVERDVQVLLDNDHELGSLSRERDGGGREREREGRGERGEERGGRDDGGLTVMK